MHKYSVGQFVYFVFSFGHKATLERYTITRLAPIERDNRVIYRIKNPAETFECTAEENQLTAAIT